MCRLFLVLRLIVLKTVNSFKQIVLGIWSESLNLNCKMKWCPWCVTHHFTAENLNSFKYIKCKVRFKEGGVYQKHLNASQSSLIWLNFSQSVLSVINSFLSLAAQLWGCVWITRPDLPVEFRWRSNFEQNSFTFVRSNSNKVTMRSGGRSVCFTVLPRTTSACAVDVFFPAGDYFCDVSRQ